MTHPRTRHRMAAGTLGLLLSAGSVAISGADAYYRPHHRTTFGGGTPVTATTSPSSSSTDTTPTTSGAAGNDAEPTVSCGKERWDVKTGTDPNASDVKLTPRTATIAELGALPVPADLSSRAAPVEDTLYEITGTLTAYKEEADSDYHLALSDDSGNTMIAEIPSPDCDVGSVFADQIASTRQAFDNEFTVTNRFKTPQVSVTIDGVGFFDKLHGQRGVAPNGIELHPVLSITFN